MRPSLAEASTTHQPTLAHLSVAACCLVIILALVLGVGPVSHTFLRHLIQTLPLCIGVVLGFRRSGLAAWVALPLFLFWLFLMFLIWSYLLGISHLVSGHFSPTEIVMTLIVGVASIVGIAAFVRSHSGLSGASRVGAFSIMALLQWACFRISFLPSVANR